MFLNFLFIVIILCSISIAECENLVSCVDTNPHEIYKCDNGNCTQRGWICDRDNDCGDNSDEKSCYSANPCSYNPYHYQCFESTKCIRLESLCNNKLDCPFGDDEGPKCQKFRNSCTSINCSHGCMITPMGPMCRCPFPLSRTFDNMTCGTWDSSKICVSLENQTSLKCSCQFGYRQTSNESCESFPIKPVLFSAGNFHEIVRNSGAISIKYIKTDENAKVLSMTFDRKSGTIFISGIIFNSSNTSFISAVKGSPEKAQKLPFFGFLWPKSLIYDEVSDILVVLDTSIRQIIACDAIQSKYFPVIKSDIDKGSSIALDQKNGIIFWTEFTDSTIIKSANLDGSANSETFQIEVSIIIENIFFNENDRNLYFISDSESGTVGVVFSNNSYELFTQNKFSHGTIIGNFFNNLLIFHSFGLSVFDAESMVLSSDITRVSYHLANDSVFGIYQPRPAYLSKLKNPCLKANCDYLCLRCKSGYSCVNSYFKNTSQQTCIDLPETHDIQPEISYQNESSTLQTNNDNITAKSINNHIETNTSVYLVTETIFEEFDSNTQPNLVSKITEPANEEAETWLNQSNDRLNKTLKCDDKLNQTPYKYLFIILCALNLVAAIFYSVTKIIIYRKNRHTGANLQKKSFMETLNEYSLDN